MRQRRTGIKINTSPVASQYSGLDERIVEVFDSKTGNGCLISIRRMDDSRLKVETYRAGEPAEEHHGYVLIGKAAQWDLP